MTFARRVFRFAGIYGLIVLLPQYFLEARIGHDVRPPITHPEFFYGFLGVAAAWQVAFLIVTRARCGTGRSCWPGWSRSFHLR